jgi:cytochrome c oxidase assembly factor CtaG
VLASGVAGGAVDPLSLVLVMSAATLYLAGRRRLHRRGRRWSVARTTSFAAGLAALALATQGPLAEADTTSFTAHVAQHVLLGIVGPFLLALGAPVTLALQASHRPTQVNLLRLLNSRPARVLTHPAVALALFSGTLFALYFSPVYELSLRHALVHAAVHAHFVVVGSLLFWVTIGLDPVAHRLPYGARLVLVLLTVPFHAFLGVALLNAPQPVARDWYRGAEAQALRPATDAELLADQRRGASVMWAIGDVVGLAAGAVIGVQWMRHEERKAARRDHDLEATVQG